MTEIDKFLNDQATQSTKTTYKSNLKLYFNSMKKNPDTYFKNKPRDSRGLIIDIEPYKTDIKQFWKFLKSHSNSRPTRNTGLNAIKQFCIFNGVEFPQQFWKSLRKTAEDKGSRPATLDKCPTPAILKKILGHAGAKGRAMVLTLSSSGMRVSELVQILPGDLDLTHDPPMINIRAETTKTRTARYAFISPEAKDAIETWMLEHDDFLIRAHQKTKNINRFEKPIKDDRIFPLTPQGCREIWNNLLRSSGFDERDNSTKIKYRRYHLHTLRKYFRTYLSMELQDEEIPEALMGHERYLTSAYRRYNLEQIGEKYKQGLKSIQVFEATPDLTHQYELHKEKDEQIKNLTELIKTMQMQMEIMENKIQLERLKNGNKN